MAESIVKLRVDTKDYDANIKSARQGLMAMEQACRKVGVTFEVVEKAELDYVKALGKMETSSRSAKGKIAELTSAFTDLKAQYNRLTDAEKQSEYGKALSGSLAQLKERIQEGNKELKNIQGELGGTGGAMDALTDKLGMSVASFAKFTTAGAAITTALKVAKDAFFANEEQLDEWGRVCQSAQSMYDGLLTALNTGDISGYLSRMDQIVNAAREAYNAMDELGTFKAFNQRNELQGRNNMQNAINNYREGKGSKEDVQKAGEAYIQELQKRQTLESSNYAAQIREVAAQKGVDAKELEKILTGDYASYKKAKEVTSTGKRYESISGGNTGYTMNREVVFAQTPEEKMGEALRMFNDKALNEIQRIGTEEVQTSIEIESVRKQIDRATGVTTPKGSNTTTPKSTNTPKLQPVDYSPVKGLEFQGEASLNEVQSLINAWKKTMMETTSAETRATAQQQIIGLGTTMERMKVSLEPSEEAMNELRDNVQSWLDSQPPLTMDVNTGNATKDAKATAQAWSAASAAVTSAGQALQNTGDKGMNVAGIIMQAVANVALGFAQASASPATSTTGIFGWIAASTAGIATMTATIASIKNAARFETGGVVGGSSFTGDKLIARVNSGETILNKSQAERALAMMEGGIGSSGGGITTISGEQLVTVINAYGRRTGRGEILR